MFVQNWIFLCSWQREVRVAQQQQQHTHTHTHRLHCCGSNATVVTRRSHNTLYHVPILKTKSSPTLASLVSVALSNLLCVTSKVYTWYSVTLFSFYHHILPFFRYVHITAIWYTYFHTAYSHSQFISYRI